MFAAIAVVTMIALVSYAVLAQPAAYEPVRDVYRIRASGCTAPHSDRVLTGFKIRGEAGIYTALHGVVDCDGGVSATTGDWSATYTDLRIVKADIEHDIALLWSRELPLSGGLSRVQSARDGDFMARIIVVGYPKGLLDQSETEVKVPYQKMLRQVVQPEAHKYLQSRSSPSLTETIYEVRGHLTPGHSGAPLLDKRSRVLAIGNGGLDLGRIEMAWAIPIVDVDLKPVSREASNTLSPETIAALEKLKYNVSPEFAFNYTPPVEDQPEPLRLSPTTHWDSRLDAQFIKVADDGIFEFGSTYAEATKSLKICAEYSGDLCAWEAFKDEILEPDSRSKGTLPDFWIMETEVTNAQYDQCVRAGGCRELGPANRTPGPATHPVRLRDAQDALNFAAWACGRLPTELEWEKAARGPDAYLYPWGNEWNARNANSCGSECAKPVRTRVSLYNDGYQDTAPVTEFKNGRSPYGLYNMAGNVREWVARDPTRQAVSNFSEAYMLKGGSFYDFPDVMRAADRLRSPVDNDGTITAGLRIARDSAAGACR